MAPLVLDYGLWNAGELLTDCAGEQLHLSGRIQAHGALVVADLQDRLISHVSANVGELTGVQPDQLFDSPVMRIFAPDEQQRLEHAIEQIEYRPSSHDLYGMRLAAASENLAAASENRVDVILHQAGGQILIEIEKAHGDYGPALAEILDASHAISEAASLPEIEADVARMVRALTGFDRAMVYRFHDDEYGEIVAEDGSPELGSYLGHHFPASDIQSEVRQIYIRTASRYIPDVDGGDVSVFASPSVAGTTLDLSLASLRSVSPHHLEYLRNMDTAASVSFSMTDGDQLTRLVSCTSESPKGLPRATLRACELLVLQAKLQISAADRISSLNDAFERESIRARLRVSLQDAPTVSEGLTSTPRDVLELCGADGAAAYVSGEYRSIGTTPSEDAVRRLTGEIRDSKSPDKPWAANRLTKSSADSLGAAGCLLVTFGGPDDFLVWFRRRRPRQLRWLRNPRACATELIDPRKSIDTRLENIVDTSVPWSEADLLAAQLLTYEVNSALFAKVQAELAHLSQHDALTGLPNRRHLSHLMGAMLAGATPTNPIAAIFVDLNQFKDVNDEYGHDAGDHVLREAARRIAEITRASDVLGRADAPALPAGRIGGDEFVVLLPGADAATATLVVNRIRQSLLDPIAISPDLHLTIGAAMGVAVATEREAPQHLLRRADAAMYEDKHRDSPTPHR